jgi:signal transduction histidine kinase
MPAESSPPDLLFNTLPDQATPDQLTLDQLTPDQAAEGRELERLRQEHFELSQQVKRLTWAERRMIESQDQLNRQIQLYYQLSQVGQKLRASLTQLDARTEAFQLAIEFIIYELNFERCLILSYEPQTQRYRATQWDGYYKTAQVERLQQLELDPADPVWAMLNCEADCLVAAMATVNPKAATADQAALQALGQRMEMDEYFLFSLQSDVAIPADLIALGNTGAAAKYHARVQPESELQIILNILLSKVSAAIRQSSLYIQARSRAEALEKALQNLQRAQTQLVQSEKMSALGNLVAGVAHEINNPLGFLAGNLQPAQDYVADLFHVLDLYQQHYPEPNLMIQTAITKIDLDYLREDLPKLIASMEIGIERIRSISNSLRTFSRADQTAPISCDIHQGIESTLLILKHRLKATEQRPAIEVSTIYGDLPPITCFPGQLNQVFMNLLANAIDALEEAGRSYEDLIARPNWIEIQTQLADQGVVISIRDNGAGMSEVVRAQIFDYLFTTKAVGKGTGLGLAIAHQIVVETHGGKLDCLSELGQGTEFQIWLPLE